MGDSNWHVFIVAANPTRSSQSAHYRALSVTALSFLADRTCMAIARDERITTSDTVCAGECSVFRVKAVCTCRVQSGQRRGNGREEGREGELEACRGRGREHGETQAGRENSSRQ